MRTLFRMMAFFMLLVGFSACSGNDDEEVVVPTLPVNDVNLEGTWKLTQWNNEPTPEGTYCYITFNRKDHSFRMYQKFDSMYARLITGEYKLKDDATLGTLISGTYDYGMGEWNNSYIVSDLLETGSMIWTAVGNAEDICCYERCEEVPDEVIEEAEK